MLTGDFDFSNILNYPPQKYFGIIVLAIPRGDTALVILNLLESFLKQDKLVSKISGKLAIVEMERVRIREK